MIKEFKYSIVGIVLAIVVVVMYNLSYMLTQVLIDDKIIAQYLALLALIIIFVGVLSDAVKKQLNKQRNQVSSDLIPQGFKPVVMPEDIKSEVDPNVVHIDRRLVKDTIQTLNMLDSISDETDKKKLNKRKVN